LLRVASVQLADFVDGKDRTPAQETADRVAKIVQYLEQAAGLGARIALFPEMSLVKYCQAGVYNNTQAVMDAAEAAVAAACARYGIWGIIGDSSFCRFHSAD
jgi:predicted amidohydrolase